MSGSACDSYHLMKSPFKFDLLCWVALFAFALPNTTARAAERPLSAGADPREIPSPEIQTALGRLPAAQNSPCAGPCPTC
jgi:hypothetical protein